MFVLILKKSIVIYLKGKTLERYEIVNLS